MFVVGFHVVAGYPFLLVVADVDQQVDLVLEAVRLLHATLHHLPHQQTPAVLLQLHQLTVHHLLRARHHCCCVGGGHEAVAVVVDGWRDPCDVLSPEDIAIPALVELSFVDCLLDLDAPHDGVGGLSGCCFLREFFEYAVVVCLVGGGLVAVE